MDVYRTLGRLLAAVVLLALPGLGCEEVSEQETVGIYGFMVVGLELSDPLLALTGGTFDAYDDEGALLSEGQEPWLEDRPGYYRVRDLPAETHVHLLCAANEDPLFVPTVRPAWTATANLYTYEGEIYILEYAWVEETLATLTEGGYGQIVDEAIDPDDEANGGFLLGSMASPELSLGMTFDVVSGETELTTLYLDEEGVARPGQFGTGPGGWFAVFGIPAGPIEIRATTSEGVESDPIHAMVFEDSCTSLIDLEVSS